jgi:hypothetical protein
MKSKYKIFGGFGLTLGLNSMIAFFIYKGIINGPKIQLSNTDTWLHNSNLTMVLISFGIQVLFLLLFMSQNKYLIIDDKGITFINPLLPFLRTKRTWDYYDECRTVIEHSQHNTHEAIWFIKDNKLKTRVSSFYYRNYKEIKRNLGIKKCRRLNINPFKQLFVIVGWKIN